jgi:hypothetical protein
MSKRPPSERAPALFDPDTGPAWGRVLDIINRYPQHRDPVLAARAALSIIDEGSQGLWLFAAHCRGLPAPVIHAALGRLVEDRRSHAFFLRECVPYEADEAETTRAWDAALLALLDLDPSHAWGSQPWREKRQALADNPPILQALQTAAVACESVPLDMLAVLAADASDASVDALMPHVERAIASGQEDAQQRLLRLRTLARSTPAMDAVLARLDAVYKAHPNRKAALGFARELGLGELDTFWFEARFPPPGGEARRLRGYGAELSVDSRSGPWFRVSLEHEGDGAPAPTRRTRFDSKHVHHDGLALGTCTPATFPDWLAAAGRKLQTEWNPGQLLLTTDLPEAQREVLERWLRGTR